MFDDEAAEPVGIGEATGPTGLFGPDLAGVSLAFTADALRVELIGRDGAPVLSLGPWDEDEVVAVWRGLAETTGLPLLVTGADGTARPVGRPTGRVRLGGRIESRRLAVLSGRRPRFLVRRKTARLPPLPRVFPKREIAAGFGREGSR